MYRKENIASLKCQVQKQSQKCFFNFRVRVSVLVQVNSESRENKSDVFDSIAPRACMQRTLTRRINFVTDLYQSRTPNEQTQQCRNYQDQDINMKWLEMPQVSERWGKLSRSTLADIFSSNAWSSNSYIYVSRDRNAHAASTATMSHTSQ